MSAPYLLASLVIQNFVSRIPALASLHGIYLLGKKGAGRRNSVKRIGKLSEITTEINLHILYGPCQGKGIIRKTLIQTYFEMKLFHYFFIHC